MYGLAVGRIRIGVVHGDGRGFVEDVSLIPARYADASHASSVVKIGDRANGNRGGRRGRIRRASIILCVLAKRKGRGRTSRTKAYLYSTSKGNMIDSKAWRRRWQRG